MKRPQLALTALLSTACLQLSSCYQGADGCPHHCWQNNTEFATQPLNLDLSPSTLPFRCEDASTAQPIPIAPLDLADTVWHATDCPSQADHETVTAVVSAIENGTTGSLFGAQILTYKAFVESLALEQRNHCLAALKAEDISDDPGLQSCTHASAVAVCNAYVMYPALAVLAVDSGTSFEPPTAAPTQVYTIPQGEMCDFQPGLGGDTGGGESTSSGGNSDTGDSTGDDGLDSTGTGSSGGAVVDPFGDVSALIYCDASGVLCSYQPELVDNIDANFSVFFQEQVSLELLRSTDADYPGVRLSGLDSGEASKDLADAFGLQNDDVLKNVNGIDIEDEADASEAIDALISSEAVALSLERKGSTIHYRILLRN